MLVTLVATITWRNGLSGSATTWGLMKSTGVLVPGGSTRGMAIDVVLAATSEPEIGEVVENAVVVAVVVDRRPPIGVK